MENYTKYEILVKVLDQLNQEAPTEFRTYHHSSDNVDLVNKARSLSFIHLFLKVKCGIVEFKARHSHITEGTFDGGLDAYHIDSDKKTIYLIQSKFKTTPAGSTVKSITANNLLKIGNWTDVKRTCH